MGHCSSHVDCLLPDWLIKQYCLECDNCLKFKEKDLMTFLVFFRGWNWTCNHC